MINEEKLLELRKKANSLPLEPGVYIMKNKDSEIIYIGKAKKLKNRVSSYFHAVENHLPKVYRMVEQVDHFDYIVTDSEFEALILECSLIKLHTPKYNILLKDAKGYSYIKISGGDYPKLTQEYRNDDPEARYIGPYISSSVTKKTVEEACKVFGLPTCNKHFPQDFGKGRPCLNYHIKQCMGVCSGRIPKDVYMEAFNDALAFIDSGGEKSLDVLTRRMNEASEALDFETAARCRDRIAAINRVTDQQKVFDYNHKSLDVIGCVSGEEAVWFSVLVIRDGRLVDKSDFHFDCLESTEAATQEFLLTFYADAEKIPLEIFLEEEIENREDIAARFSESAGRKVTITVPKIGKTKELVEMAKNNAAQALAIRLSRTGREMATLQQLARLLGMEAIPSYIEAYDISNFGGQTIVGGMIVYENGRPEKKYYKKFNIENQLVPDDGAAMYQMLTRRFDRYAQQNSDDGFEKKPDLILMDGGILQIQAAERVLKEHHLSIPVFGMVKDGHHRTRAITGDNGEITINNNRSVFTLVTAIQDEVHRYTISFSRKKHAKTAFELKLESVEGLGEKRVQALFSAFKTQKAMKEASVEELSAVPGMTKPAAQAVYAYFHPENESSN